MTEEITRQVIDDFIDSIDDEDRKLKAQQLQFRIDRELRKYKDPVARMNKMVELFWKGFEEFNETLQQVRTDK